MIEEWRSVVGFEGQYEVSSLGRVRSLDRTVIRPIGKGPSPDRCVPVLMSGRVLRPGVGSHGYLTVALGNKHRSHCVHVLVLIAFKGPPPPKMEACHNNGNKLDCSNNNLRWDTRRGNHADKLKHGTHMQGADYQNSKLTSEAVREIRRLRLRFSQKVLARKFNVSPSAVQAVIDGRTWKHIED